MVRKHLLLVASLLAVLTLESQTFMGKQKIIFKSMLIAPLSVYLTDIVFTNNSTSLLKIKSGT